METLKNSSVVFNQRTGFYQRGENSLCGITRLIREVLNLNNFSNSRKHAFLGAHYGRSLHKALQLYDDYNIIDTLIPEVYDEKNGLTYPAINLNRELEYYINLKKNKFNTLAAEFIVDFGNYATAIDAVWQDNKGNIFLVDHKTNKLESYPGGKDALMKYLEWQLSIEAFMFELQTGRKVVGLLCNWINQDKHELWKVNRLPDVIVNDLLATPFEIVDGKVIFNVAEKKAPAIVENKVDEVGENNEENNTMLVVPNAIINAITNVLVIEQSAKDMKAALREIMNNANARRFSCDKFIAVITEPYDAKVFDQKKFAADYPELFEQYIKVTRKSGSFSIKLK